jgi:type I restriction enzyme R subunit
VGHSDAAKAYYGLVREVLKEHTGGSDATRELAADIAIGIDRIVAENAIVNWVNNVDVQNRMKTAIEDLLFSLHDHAGVEFSFVDIDVILDRSISTAKAHARQRSGS